MSMVEIVFSPTGGTERVADIVAGEWGAEPVRIDLCDARADFSKRAIDAGDRVLVAMPSYGGRAPDVAIERFKQIQGNGAACALVCVYGNRAFDDTLVEMEDAARSCGFRVVAAIAAVAQHSVLPQYAANRPDAADVARLKQFARRIAERTEAVSSIPGESAL